MSGHPQALVSTANRWRSQGGGQTLCA